MNFNCQREDLSRALGFAVRAVSPQAAVDVLKGVLVVCGKDSVTVTGNNMEMGIVATLEAEVSSPGAVVLEAHMFHDIVRRSTGGEVSLSVDERGQASIVSGDAEFSIMSLPAENYPVLPEVSGLRAIVMPQAKLGRQIGKTIFSVSDQESKAVHTGVLFDAEPGTLTLVALDGHRLALRREAIENAEKFSFVVPAAPLRELERMLEGDEEASVSLHIAPRHLLVELPGLTLVTRLLEGDFLKYMNSIPVARPFAASIETKPMIRALERVGLLITEKQKNPVKMLFSDGSVRLSCVTALGRAVDVLPCSGGGDMEIGFNHRYLLDALRRADGETFRFETAGPLSPCLLLPEDGEDALFMILPVRLKADL